MARTGDRHELWPPQLGFPSAPSRVESTCLWYRCQANFWCLPPWLLKWPLSPLPLSGI